MILHGVRYRWAGGAITPPDFKFQISKFVQLSQSFVENTTINRVNKTVYLNCLKLSFNKIN